MMVDARTYRHAVARQRAHDSAERARRHLYLVSEYGKHVGCFVAVVLPGRRLLLGRLAAVERETLVLERIDERLRVPLDDVIRVVPSSSAGQHSTLADFLR